MHRISDRISTRISTRISGWIGIGLALVLVMGPAPPAGAVGGNDVDTATKVPMVTQKCQETIGKGVEKYAAKASMAIRGCLDAVLKCDEASDAAKALTCRRALLKAGGKCSAAKLDEGLSMIGAGAALAASGAPTSRAALRKEMNLLSSAVQTKCVMAGAELGDANTGLGFDPEPVGAYAVVDALNPDPGGLQCLANALVLQAYPLADEIVDVVEPLHETCIAGALLGAACTADGDCGTRGVCGKLARVFREGSIRSCAGVGRGRGYPATGQTACWNNVGSLVPCAGTGHDGELQAGQDLAYQDNGDGTITDLNTGLMWEKLDDNNLDPLHDVSTSYTWANAYAVKIAALNSAAFAGYTDWRLPNYKELISIVNLENVSPAVSTVFHSGCVSGCTVATCSCTASVHYFSSSTYAGTPTLAWIVNFLGGYGDADAKAGTLRVRAVRGGL